MKAKLFDLSYRSDGTNVLTIETREDCRGLMDDLRGNEVEVTIKKWRAKRSLDANAYSWILMDKLASHLNVPKQEIYRNAIRDVGGNTDVVCVPDKAVERLRDCWTKNGLGWITDTFPSKLDGCTNVILYYGSSTFDTAQMSRFIDNLVQDCKTLGIETMPPDKLNALLEGWT